MLSAIILSHRPVSATPDLEGAGPFVPDLVIDEVPVQTTAALTVTLTGTGSGTVTSSPAGVACTGGFGVACSASFATGTTVTLSATPASGSTFAGWGGACSGTAVCTVPLASARLMVATFTVPPPWVTQYHHTDALGSVRAVTDAAGAVVRTHDYHPFGEGVGVASGTDPVRFTGKPRDVETGLDYFGARYYAQGAGRFTTVDPVYTWQENLVDPERWNRYAYVRNNPGRYVDPDGRILWPVVAAAAAAAILTPSNANAPRPGDPIYEGDNPGNVIVSSGIAGVGEFVGGKIAQAVGALFGRVFGRLSSGADDALNGVRLGKQLASEAQMAERGTRMAGPGTGKPFRDVDRIVATYGGRSDDWVKVSSGSYTAKDGARF